MSEDKLALLAKVASLYYEKNLTQAEIAQRLNISRPQVSRLLAEGRQEGVVEIIIHHPAAKSSSLEQELLDRFALKEIKILVTGAIGYSQLVERLGVLAARHMEERLEDGMILGISWNTGVYQVVNALRAAHQKKVTVVQLTGAVGSINPLIDGPDLTRWLAQTLGGQYKYLPAPLLVESPATREALLQDRSIRESMALLDQMDMALIGIGSLSPALSSLLLAGYITETELREIIRQGGVGDICSYHFDLRGRILPLELHQRLIGVSLDTLKKTPYVIGVGGGIDKASAVLGALRLGVLDCLVTDEIAARAVLKMSTQS
ncbi:MAG: sugar-binding domain-containing protein [Anaerolineae bacterium]|nr:sugar-binding transcriptional regulator [Anaerolineales bacterium]MCQ3975864.1 sugar-binding protein [Anaerolineae bacterium]